jgi:hypothetical protein
MRSADRLSATRPIAADPSIALRLADGMLMRAGATRQKMHGGDGSTPRPPHTAGSHR